MRMGMIGHGHMGAGMRSVILRAGHDCVVHDDQPEVVERLTGPCARAVGSLAQQARALAPPRAPWLLVTAAAGTPSTPKSRRWHAPRPGT